MNALTVYLFNDDGLFCDTYEAQESPEEPGRFITPELSTSLRPPPETPGHNRIFIGGQWALVAIPPVSPPSPPTVEEQAAEKLELLSVVRFNREIILNRLTGHYIDADAAGDAVAKAAILACRVSLKDVMQDQRVLEAVNGEVKEAIFACYEEIIQQLAATAPQVLVAFKGLDAL